MSIETVSRDAAVGELSGASGTLRFLEWEGTGTLGFAWALQVALVQGFLVKLHRHLSGRRCLRSYPGASCRHHRQRARYQGCPCVDAVSTTETKDSVRSVTNGIPGFLNTNSLSSRPSLCVALASFPNWMN